MLAIPAGNGIDTHTHTPPLRKEGSKKERKKRKSILAQKKKKKPQKTLPFR